MYKLEYFFIFEFLIISVIISIFLYFLSYLIISKDVYLDKNIAYECGFNAFSDARQPFEVRFYLVGLLFIIFDLEIIFLFPYIVLELNYNNFIVMSFFVTILFMGFVYEWMKKAIQWT